MKKLFYIFLLLPFAGWAQAPQYNKRTTSIVVSGATKDIGYWEFLPENYSAVNPYHYPVIIFLHGQQTVRQSPTDLLTELDEINDPALGGAGLPVFLKNGATMVFNTPHGPESFIVLIPQKFHEEDVNHQEAQFQPYYVDAMIQRALLLNSDPTRIFLTGFSLGAGQVWDYPTYSIANARRIRAIVPVSGIPVDAYPTTSSTQLCTIAANNVSVRGYSGDVDGLTEPARTVFQTFNSQCNPATPAVLEVSQGTHDPLFWDKVYNPAYAPASPGLNMYQWMLSLSANAALPIDLLYLKGKNLGEANILNWSTTKEVNFDHFELLRSTDGQEYTSIAVVKASTANTATRNYEFKDKNAPKGRSFYKIKQVDKDGKFTITKVVSILNKNLAFVVEKYPNPVADVLNLTFEGTVFGAFEFRIFDMQGRLQQKLPVKKDQQLWKGTMNVESLAKGIYTIELKGENGKLDASTFIKR